MRAKAGRAGDAPGACNSRVFALGLALAFSTTVTAALQPVVIRYGAVRIDALLYCAGAVIVAGAVAAPLLYRRGELGALFSLRYAPRLACLSMSGTVMTSLALTYGLRRIGAVAGVLLLQSEPIYSLLLTTLVIRERPSPRQLLATAAIIAGIASVLDSGGAFSPVYAAILILLTPLFWQAAHVLSLPVMPPLTPTCITGARYIYAAILFAFVLAADPGRLGALADVTTLTVIVVTGLLINFAGSLTWYGAISRLSLSWTTALVIPGVPLLSIIFAILFLGEQATWRELAGISIAVSGVLALMLWADPYRKQPAAEAAEVIHRPPG